MPRKFHGRSSGPGDASSAEARRLHRFEAMLIAAAAVGWGAFFAVWALLTRRGRTHKSPMAVTAADEKLQPSPAVSASPAGTDLPANRRPATVGQPALSLRKGADGAVVGASAESVRDGFEPLSTHTRTLGLTLVVFVIVAAGMLGGLALLLRHDLADDRQADPTLSAAPVLADLPPAPLEPMPLHNELDWQDLVHLRQDEDARFRHWGWAINLTTGEPTIPAQVMAEVGQHVGTPTAGAAAPDPLRFPPTLSPVRAGASTSLDRSDVFPPVGAAATAEQTKESIYRPPSNTPDLKDMPTQSGPPGRQNVLTAIPPRE